MPDYEYTDIYLEQGLIALSGMGMTPDDIKKVRKVLREKMHWAQDAGSAAGFEQGKWAGVVEARKSMEEALNDLSERL